MIKRFVIIFIFFTHLFGSAQINELGIQIGGSNYIGDVGDETYFNPTSLSYGLIYKWNLSPRVAFRAAASYIKIADDDANASNLIRQEHNYSFKNTIKEGSIGIEFNYYDYSLVTEGWSSTPYLILEAAVFNYNVAVEEKKPGEFVTDSKMGFTIPFGIGYKTKIVNSIGINAETRIRYTFRDDLDYNNAAIPSLNFGNPDANDWYITAGINIVFGFGRKACYSEAY